MKSKVNFNTEVKDDTCYLFINWKYGYKITDTLNNKVKYLPLKVSTGYHINSAVDFDSKNKRVKKHPDKSRINSALDKLEREILSFIDNYKYNNDELPSPDQIKEHLNKESSVIDSSPSINRTGLTEYVERHCKKKKFIKNTVKSYNQFKTKVELFQKKNSKIYIENITKKLYEDFISFVEDHPTQRGEIRSINDMYRYKSIFRRMLNEARKDGIESKFKNFDDVIDPKQVSSDNVYLNSEQIQKVKEVDLSDYPDLVPIRDMFLIGIYTGLRISDLKRVKLSHIETKDNIRFLVIHQKKTTTKVKIPITDFVYELLNKYGGTPNMSEQYFNRTVKEVCKKSGLDHNVEVIEKRVGGNQIHNKPFYELVSAHTCRRSFCTNLFKKGISPQVIMIYSGHTQLNSFYKYIKVKPSDMIEDFLTQVKNGLNEI